MSQETLDSTQNIKKSSNIFRSIELGALVSEQVSQDLNNLLKTSRNLKNGLRIISEKIEVDRKTILRLSEKKSKPNYITVFKIYRFLLGENDESKVLQKAPEVIRDYLKQANPIQFEKKVSYSAQIEAEMKSNPVFAEIYILISTGPIKSKEIENRFGSYGLDLVEKMKKMSVFSLNREGDLVLGLMQAPVNLETLISLGMRLTERYWSKQRSEELGQNIISFYAEGLSTEAYKKWLEIDQRAAREKIEVAKRPDSKGNVRAFMFSIVEKMEQERND